MLTRKLLNNSTNFLRCAVIGLICFVTAGSEACAQVSLDTSKISIQIPSEISFCIDAPLELAADSIWGGSPPYTLRWEMPEGTQTTGATLIWQGSDSTQITLHVFDARGRTSASEIFLTPYPAIDASFTADETSGCSPFQAVFSSDYIAFQHANKMEWDFGDGSTAQSMASAIHDYTVAGEFHPALTITDTHGCRYSDTLQVPMRAFPSPLAKFKLVEDQLYLPETTARMVNESEGASAYLWRFDQYGVSSENSPHFDFPEGKEGRFVISLKVENTFGCFNEEAHELNITQGISLFMPNAFTPDGDGINDSWSISGLGVDAFRFHIEIYDAWGVVVFASENADAQWQGERAQTGEKAHPGMYNYRVLARDTEHGVGHLFEGHIQLLR